MSNEINARNLNIAIQDQYDADEHVFKVGDYVTINSHSSRVPYHVTELIGEEHAMLDDSYAYPYKFSELTHID
jgi:hypothetical protein